MRHTGFPRLVALPEVTGADARETDGASPRRTEVIGRLQSARSMLGLAHGAVELRASAGTPLLSPEAVADLIDLRHRLDRLLDRIGHAPACPEPPMLTPREQDVLVWMTRGKSNATIAQILDISRHTVDTHVRRIFRKLDAGDRTTATVRAIATGLVATP